MSRTLRDRELQFGQTVASACAVAIRNARLFDSFRDQTERINYMRLVAEKQMEALKKYEDFFEYAADGMAIVDTQGEILYVNREGRRLLGRERDEVRSHRFTDFLAEESQKRWPEVVDLVRHGRFHKEHDFFISAPEGEDRIFSLSAGGGGQDTGLIILSFRDVTETREMEIELRTTKDFLENLIDSSVDAIVAADMSGQIMLFNRGAEKIYGYRAEDVIGRMNVRTLYPGNMSLEIMRQLRDDRWGGRGRLVSQRKEIRTNEGVEVPVSMTASIIYEDGDEVATVGVFQDLRERLKIEQQLTDAQDELMRAEKAQVAAELAGMAAHELNQPLTSVLGYAEMLRLKVPKTEPKLKKHVDIIYDQAERMAEIVRKIGKITKHETTHYTSSTTMMDLDASVGEDPEDLPPELTLQEPRVSHEETTGPQRRFRPGAGSTARGSGRARSAAPAADEVGTLARLASLQKKPDADPNADPRAAIIRLDTIDEEETGTATDTIALKKHGLRRRRIKEEPTLSLKTLAADDLDALEGEDRERGPFNESEVTNPGIRLEDLRARYENQRKESDED